MAKMEILFTKSKNNDVFARVKAFKNFEHSVPGVPHLCETPRNTINSEYQLLKQNK